MNQSVDFPIAQIVLDLPLEGPFDYLIPQPLRHQLKVGCRVMVPFGPRKACGIVTALLEKTAIEKIKSVYSVVDESPLLGNWQMKLSLRMAQYYGCSQGQALFSFLPPLLRKGKAVSVKTRVSSPSEKLHQSKAICRIAGEGVSLKKDIDPYLEAGHSVLVLVPDIYYLNRLKAIVLKEFGAASKITVGTRSSVFAPIANLGLVIMVDEDNASFQEEQTPMYHARDMLLMRQEEQGFDLLFLSLTPSVALKALIDQGRCSLEGDGKGALPARIKTLDLTNYKIVASFLSPPLYHAIDAALKDGKKALLVLNRRGSYNVTRCVDCGYCVKCQHCDSPMIFVRSAKEFQCRHCTFKLGVDTQCPKCKKPNWKSFGMGVEQLQTQLKKNFPFSRIASFERETEEEPKAFDILVSTQACLRLKGKMSFAVVALVDIDSALSKMQLQSAQEALSLARQLSVLSSGEMLVQTRNLDHYVIQALGRNDLNVFYDQEMLLRKELGFAPFKHWVQVTCRSGLQKNAQQALENIYNALVAQASSLVVIKPAPDALEFKRGQYRFVMKVQGKEVIGIMGAIKAAMASVKRSSRVIVTFNVDA